MGMKLADLLDIPTSAHRADFVVDVSKSVRNAGTTLGTYVVTDQLSTCFVQALSLITTALADGTSKGAYLHGSFGSGKSHFMAVLHLLVQGDTTARAIPELGAVVARHDPRLEGRRVLQLPLHMIGAASMEAGVLGGYVRHVREHLPPGTPLPAVFLDDELLADAEGLRTKLGDERFLAGLGGGDGGWGALDAGWDGARYDGARVAPPGDPERDRLVGDLVEAYFSATVGRARATGEGYVAFSEGLGAISRHAQSLGYDAVVLFLDELILWFATRMADPSFVRREGPKVAPLVESGGVPRPVPLVSFIARQRDLREFLGEGVPGAEHLSFGDVLRYFEGRFDTIELADRNLPAIIERRLLAPRSEAARQAIDAAFDDVAAGAGRALDTLLGDEHDRAAFRRVYPFSPALVDALVAVSAFLQRERTALRLLQQLLVEQRDTLELGDIVPVGDLWDVVAGGEEPFSEELRRHFATARRLYDQRLRPALLEQYGMDEDRVAVLPHTDRFHTDDRLVKTLLVAALAPQVAPLRELRVSRLAELNHGTIRAPIPGTEATVARTALQRLQAHVPELRVDGDDDPAVSLQLSGVDTRRILDAARGADTPGARRQQVRELVGAALGLDLGGGLTAATRKVVWRGSERRIEVRFGNVRDATDLPESELRAGDHPLVVVDFPFDEPGRTPNDDLARVRELRDAGFVSTTVCWLPLFLTEAALARLGDLVVCRHVLAGDRFADVTRDLPPPLRAEARALIENQARSLGEQTLAALRQAYGIETPDPAWVRPDIAPAEQLATLEPTMDVRTPTGPGLDDALGQVVDQVLAQRFPDHPRFESLVTLADLRTVLRHVEAAIAAPHRRVDVAAPADRRAVRKVVGPLGLGETGEAHLVVGTRWAEHVNRMQAREPGAPVTVDRLRRWTDQPTPRGLKDEVANLVVCTYALLEDRVLMEDGRQVALTVDRLAPGVELRSQRLPESEDWERGVKLAAAVFGATASPRLLARTVSALADEVRAAADRVHVRAERLAAILDAHAERLGIDPSAPRLATARAGAALCTAVLAAADDADVVRALATADVPTSPAALGRSLATGEQVAAAVEGANWELLAGAGRVLPEGPGVLDRLAEAAGVDELTTGLTDALARAGRAATDLVVTPREPPPQDPPEHPEHDTSRRRRRERRTPATSDERSTLLRELLADVDDLNYLEVIWEPRS